MMILLDFYGIMIPVAAIAQSVERIHGKDEVSGSNPDRGSRGKLVELIDFYI